MPVEKMASWHFSCCDCEEHNYVEVPDGREPTPPPSWAICADDGAVRCTECATKHASRKKKPLTTQYGVLIDTDAAGKPLPDQPEKYICDCRTTKPATNSKRDEGTYHLDDAIFVVCLWTDGDPDITYGQTYRVDKVTDAGKCVLVVNDLGRIDYYKSAQFTKVCGFVRCTSNRHGAVNEAGDLTVGKLYSMLEDEAALAEGMLRVVDDSGDIYLYDAKLFSELLPAWLYTGQQVKKQYASVMEMVEELSANDQAFIEEFRATIKAKEAKPAIDRTTDHLSNAILALALHPEDADNRRLVEKLLGAWGGYDREAMRLFPLFHMLDYFYGGFRVATKGDYADRLQARAGNSAGGAPIFPAGPG